MKKLLSVSLLAVLLFLPAASAQAVVNSLNFASGVQGGQINNFTINGQGMPTGGTVAVTIGATQLPYSISSRNDTKVIGQLTIPSSIPVGATTLNVNVNGESNSFAFTVVAPGGGTNDIPPGFQPPGEGQIPGTAGQLIGVIQTLTNWIFGILLAVSVIFLVWAAFEFVTGGPDGAKSGQQKLLYAAIGIALALVAFGLPQIIKSIVLTS